MEAEMTTPGDIGMIIEVRHDCADGWHTFTSDQVPGLFLAGERADLEELYEEIPQVIAALAKCDFGRDVEVTPAQTYSDYAASLPDTHLPVKHYTIRDLAKAA
jgi:hypothetical protein